MAARRGRPIISFRVDPATFAALQAQWDKEGVTMATFMDRMACKQAEIASTHTQKGKKPRKRRVNKPKSAVDTPKDVEQPDMRFIAWFREQYLLRVHSEYIPSWARDRRIARRLLNKLEVTELAARAVRMLDSTDEFIVKTGRDLTVLERWINRFTDNGRAGKPRREPKGFAGFRKPEQKNLIPDSEQPPP
jgi:hypothetical protein